MSKNRPEVEALTPPAEHQTRQGVYYALAAYAFWGVAPVYFKWVDQVSPWEILSHRVIWAVVLLLAILAYSGQLHELRIARRQLPKLLLTATLISANWLIFIYAVVNSRITETALGYFINPLISVLLAVIVLKEGLRPLQWIAIGMAMAGIGIQLVVFGKIPWLGLSLAFSFGLYGLFRKNLGMHPIAGLAIETILVAPFAVIFLVWSWSQGSLAFGGSINTDLLLILAGFVTSFPLLCFAAAVVRLPLTVMGMIQYLAPSLSLLLAVFAYGEPFSLDRMVTFGCIWLGLAIFTCDAWFNHRRYPPLRAPAAS